jgi:hypothetical protein
MHTLEPWRGRGFGKVVTRALCVLVRRWQRRAMAAARAALAALESDVGDATPALQQRLQQPQAGRDAEYWRRELRLLEAVRPYVHTRTDNAPAAKLFSDLGFQIVGQWDWIVSTTATVREHKCH